MDILFSQKMRRLSQSYGLMPEELAFADLCAAGWDKTDAYFVSMRTGESWTKPAIDNAIREISARAGVKKRIKDLRFHSSDSDSVIPKETDDTLMDSISKENMLLDLAAARKKMKPGSKEWLDINKMISDITRMKQEEIKTEDTTVHFFLPLTCKKCSLYNKSVVKS